MYNIHVQYTKSKHKNGDIINMKTPHPLSTPGVHYYFLQSYNSVNLGQFDSTYSDTRLFFHVICFYEVFS